MVGAFDFRSLAAAVAGDFRPRFDRVVAMLNALSVFLRGGDPDGRLRARKSFARQGFVAAEVFDWERGVLDAWGCPSQSAIGNCIVRTQDGFAACVGPLWYRGHFGDTALRLLLDEIDDTVKIDEGALRGNFALFLRKDKHCLLMNDALGFVRLYASADGSFYSTSWLAACAYAGHVDLDEDAAAEYVLLGASHSDRTVAQGITTLPLAHAFDLTQRRTHSRFSASFWTEAPVPATFNEAADAIEVLLRATFTDIAATFPNRVRVALSGGFDSRLILAALLACGEQPELFVYGGPESEDTPIARAVAARAGIPINVVDKGALNTRFAIPDLDRLVTNALFFDGLPNDGIDDPGADRKTRMASTAGGRLAPNGGGGEIFRNFFHLPDRTFHAIDIVRSFYRGFDSEVFRRRDGLARWQDRLAASIESMLGLEPSTVRRGLGREQVELIYPLFRCHHWMGVNNSAAVRHGHYVTPLVDRDTVRFACRLPLAWKNAGRLESRLIAALDRGIADELSTYGFGFTDGPNRNARFKEWTTCVRPVFARPFINATRRRLRPTTMATDRMAQCRALLPGEWRMDSVLDLKRLPDDYAFARALAIEIVWRELVP